MKQKVAVDISRVTKIYGAGNAAVRAIDDVTLQIFDNEFLTLLGPSGCGKTTLLRMIAGFEDITSGRIKLFDEEIENLPRCVLSEQAGAYSVTAERIFMTALPAYMDNVFPALVTHRAEQVGTDVSL